MFSANTQDTYPTDVESFSILINRFLKGTLGDKQKFKLIEQRLNSFTKTKECWVLVLDLLIQAASKNRNQEDQRMFLATNILKDKFKYDFGQLSPSDFQTVHQSLIRLIHSIDDPQAPVRNNLSLCVVYLYMRRYAEIGDLLDYLRLNLGKPQLLSYVFTIIMMLPQELTDYKVVVEEEKRVELGQHMKQHLQKRILIELNLVAAQQWDLHNVRRTTLLRCYSNWLKVHPNPELLASLPGHFLLQTAVKQIGDPAFSEECQEAIVTTIQSISEPQAHKQLFVFLAVHVLGICQVLCKLIEDQEIQQFLEPYIKVVCEFARKAIPEFLSAPTQQSNTFLQKLVFISSQRNVEYIEQTTKFWAEFCTEIVRASPEFGANYYSQLLRSVLVQSCYVIQFQETEAIELNTLSEEQVSGRKNSLQVRLRHRQDLREVINLIGEVIGYSVCIDYMISHLASVNLDSNKAWCKFECLLFGLCQLSDNLRDYNPSPELTKLLEQVLTMKPPLKCVQKQVLKLVSACSDYYQQNMSITLGIFNYVNIHLKDPQLASIASKTFENICQNNPTFVKHNLPNFLELFSQNTTNQRMLLGLVSALASDQDLLTKHIQSLITPYVRVILGVMEVKSQDQQQQTILKDCITKLSKIVATLSKNQENRCDPQISALFEALWPSIRQTITHPNPSNQFQILEKVFSLLKHVMRYLKQKFWRYMEEVFSDILSSYKKYPIASYIYAVEVAVTVFCKYPENRAALYIIFEKTCDITFEHLSAIQHLEDNPYLANDFFGMCTRFLRYQQEIILKCTRLQNILKLASAACGAQDKGISKSLYAFIQRLYMMYWGPDQITKYNQGPGRELELKINNPPENSHIIQALRPIILSFSGLIVQKIVQHLNDVPPSAVREYITDVLMSEIKAFPCTKNQEIWTQALSPLAQDILTYNQKNTFISRLVDLSQENIQHLEDHVHRIGRRFLNSKLRGASV